MEFFIGYCAGLVTMILFEVGMYIIYGKEDSVFKEVT